MSGDTVVFESWRGKYSDSPRAVSERLGEVRPELRRIWVVSGPEVELPDDVERVVRNTPAYFLRIASARYFLSNDMMPRYPLKTSRTTYVQLWHGTPLKRIGFDVPDAQYVGADVYAHRLAKDVCRWDHLVSPNHFSTDKFRQAFRYTGSVLEIGYPRNDVLSGPTAAELRDKVRADLGLGPSVRAVLYTPTWRDDALTGSAQPNPLAANAEEVLGGLPDDTVLLFRFHHLVAASSPVPRHPRILDVSDHPDIQALYLAADVMITDYSSTMFDFAVTGRPMVFYTYDLAGYRDQLRGFYFDLEQEAPGPLVTTSAELTDVLRDDDVLRSQHAAAYDAFRQKYCHLDDGHATDRLIEKVFSS
ncbi:CDP-glycerol glycerophosphotransferase [Kribbella sp. VKM Ac-2527]|uniref:CDP-glycerol glycerophosphotransferase n=1 Tax=Kribbella caucasensis TaxID=2512215 RepID=A0A4R6K7J1_9ACTN|nr:CDP-glycerol glycerophosphotransferase family protein [Kribbella sp. VKM Ac-2527]TDO43345.1 CDP-glycerol glycerophosphotransferase [Kribbella sp. VKM Ac-2527]